MELWNGTDTVWKYGNLRDNLWNIFTIFTVVWISRRASASVIDLRSHNSSSISREGSGSGTLSEWLEYTDDDSTEDDVKSERWEDGGNENGRLAVSNMTNEANHIFDITDPIYCFRCHGDGNNGCDVMKMLRETPTYSVSCQGNCLNVSSGSHAVYDCASDMQSQVDRCLQNGDTRMCFCSRDFCNGPPEFLELQSSTNKPIVFPGQPMPPQDAHKNVVISDSAVKRSDDNVSKTRNTTDISRHSNNSASTDDVAEGNVINLNVDFLLNKLSSDNITSSLVDTLSGFQKHTLDFIISKNKSDYSDKISPGEALPSRVIDISELRVGTLKEHEKAVDSSNRWQTGHVPLVVMGLLGRLMIYLTVS